MAHTKAAGSTRLGRESASQRLGIKLFDGQSVKVGFVLARQRGTKWVPGKNVKKGSDDTLYATSSGTVKFTTKKLKHFDGNRKIVKVINVIDSNIAK
ncbi:MAG TPA: 50S ribosomal protein L27 [Candidatus Paceibacterota bacterium]